jgi:hypothetical protein
MKKKSLLWSILGLFVFLAIGMFFYLSPTSKTTQTQTSSLPSGTNVEENNVVLDITTEASTIRIGDTFSVAIKATSKKPLLAIDLPMKYDTKYLTVKDIKPGTLFSNPIVFSKKIDESVGNIFFALGSVEPASTNGTVAIVTFSATASTNNASVELIKDKVVASVKGAQKGIVAVNNTKIAISQ